MKQFKVVVEVGEWVDGCGYSYHDQLDVNEVWSVENIENLKPEAWYPEWTDGELSDGDGSDVLVKVYVYDLDADLDEDDPIEVYSAWESDMRDADEE